MLSSRVSIGEHFQAILTIGELAFVSRKPAVCREQVWC